MHAIGERGEGARARSKSSVRSHAMVLLTAASSELGVSIAAHLRSSGVKQLSLTSCDECALGHDAATEDLVAGAASIIHLEPALVSDDEPDDDWVDRCTRTTFNLLVAAEAAGCAHFVLLSRMDVFVNLDLDIGLVSPSWRPRPSVSPGSLGPHLAEFTARQLAFSTGQAGGAYEPTTPMQWPKMKVTIVRIGGKYTVKELVISIDTMWKSTLFSRNLESTRCVSWGGQTRSGLSGAGSGLTQRPSVLPRPRLWMLRKTARHTPWRTAASCSQIGARPPPAPAQRQQRSISAPRESRYWAQME
jgi:hypothetical protein